MILTPIEDTVLRDRLASLGPDSIRRFSLLEGTIRGAVLGGTTLCAQLQANHRLGILETLALSQAYLAALLVSVTVKDGERIGIRMDCSGVLKGFSVESTWDGRVRGYLFNEEVKLEKSLESFDLKPFIGQGTLSVIRRSSNGETFTGHVELVHSHIAEDIAGYFLKSEQTRTALAVSICFDREGRVAGAGGLFLQAMPGATELDIEDTEDRIAELPSIGQFISEGHTGKDLVDQWYGAFAPVWLTDSPVSFSCDCSRDRFAGFLEALSGDELDRMIVEGPYPAELVCHNCGSRYLFSREELEALAQRRHRPA